VSELGGKGCSPQPQVGGSIERKIHVEECGRMEQADANDKGDMESEQGAVEIER
jgi:hypothetical protein